MNVLRQVKGFIRRAAGPLPWATSSYAQEGEDLVVKRLFDGKEGGFYVEVGCHHPFRFSNTYLFYKRGWRGICVDPLPGTAALFKRWRPRDIALELGVSATPSALTYFMFNDPALNTFDETLARERNGLRNYRIVAQKNIFTESLASILEKNLPTPQQPIDFFSIDVEGLDLEVLRSNDWHRFSPRVVIAECLDSDITSIPQDPVAKLLAGAGYRPYAKTGHSVIFLRS